tara:strand:- start:87 stop:767 length:681 start_codon:yes stop_codon:yes gene_type:complete
MDNYNKKKPIETIDKMRMVEINTYNTKLYKNSIKMLKIFITTIIAVIALNVLNKIISLPRFINNAVFILILIIGCGYLLRNMWDLYWRDNMNFDEYNWYNMGNYKPTVIEYDEKHFSPKIVIDNIINSTEDLAKKMSKDIGIECIGSECCGPHQEFDKKNNKCIHSESNEHMKKHVEKANASTKEITEAYTQLSSIYPSLLNDSHEIESYKIDNNYKCKYNNYALY